MNYSIIFDKTNKIISKPLKLLEQNENVLKFKVKTKD